jgi:hypothetical protein
MLVFIMLVTCGLHGGGLWLFMLIIMVYWFSSWCRYFGHSDVGLCYMVLGGTVAIMCIFAWVMGRGSSL